MPSNAKILLATAVLALSPLAAQAQHHGGGHSGGGTGAGHWAGHTGGHVSGGSHWGNGHWAGSHWNGGHWGYRGGWYARPAFGFYFGLPLFWGPYWDSYYYPGYAYPGDRVIYREEVGEPQPIEGVMQPPAEGAAAAPPAPPAANPLSTNYCASAKAYFPQVRSCPEGWQHTSPNS